jgi:hypothetical protein
MNPVDLQQLMDRELKQLPTPRAPETLLPRVLAATVHRKPAPWCARAWVTWPRGWQVASVVAFVAIAVGLSLFMPAVQHAPADVASRVAASAPGRIAGVAGTVEKAATLMRVFWRVLLEPVAFYLLVLAVSLSLACAAIWTALERVALGGASHQ